MSFASVIGSNIREQTDWIHFVKNSKLAKLQADINFGKRRIITLQSELSDLKSAELLIMQKMNTDIKFNELNKYYSYDRFQNNDPINMFKPATSTGMPNPDPRISSTRNKLMKGLEAFMAERDRIGNDILKVSQEIQKQKQILIDAQAEMAKLGKDVKIFASKNDIAKRAYAEVYMLHEIYIKYKALTTDANEVVKYNDADQLVAQFNGLSDKFKAYGERNPYVVHGDLILDFNNPGSADNGVALSKFMDRLRQLIGNDDVQILDPKLKSYCDQMESNVNDPWKSKNLTRAVDSGRVPTTEAQSKTYSDTPAKLVKDTNLKVGPGSIKYTMSWDFFTRGDAVKSNFKKQVSKLYKGIPYCAQNPLSPSETEQKIIEAENQAAEIRGAEIMATQFAKTKTVVSMDNINKAVDLLLNDVETNVKSKADRGIAGAYALVLPQVSRIVDPNGKFVGSSPNTKVNLIISGNYLYTATNLYQTRILSSAFTANEYLREMRLSGNLEEGMFRFFMDLLTELINQANPKIESVPSNI